MRLFSCIFAEDKAALGNLKASFHCARLHYLCMTINKLSPLEKVIFYNFFKCNHLIIKWHFVGKRTKNYFLKWTQLFIFKKRHQIELCNSLILEK